MVEASSNLPLWLLAELTYACPLQCAYCSNPIDYSASRKRELSTEEWLVVMSQARAQGAVQIGFSGGEPLLRKDLEALVAESNKLGYYSNLITSTVGMDSERLLGLKEVGLDHIQVSFQGAKKELNDYYAANKSFEHKVAMAKEIKRLGFPMVLNFVLHRDNIDQIEDILALSLELDADYVELANCQYYGWAFENRDRLLPSREQLRRAEAITDAFRKERAGNMKLYFVAPDYYESRPKMCSNGWGTTFLTVTPDGLALPCQSARVIPDIEFPSVREHSLQWIWQDSPLFNRFRGTAWMKEPCRSCPEREKDLGGCRCQAVMLTGDAANADPVCDLSPHHQRILDVVEYAQKNNDRYEEKPLFFRNSKTAKNILSRS